MFHGLSPAADNPSAFEYHADMAYSPSSFRYYLANATQCPNFSDRGNVLEHSAGEKTWRVTHGPERFEGVALLKMARMQVTLRLEGYTRAEGDAFLTRFLHHYQRGGG
jgi:hypothetical protein